MPQTRQCGTELLTVGQVADYLQLNKLTIYKYIREGRLPAVKIGKVYRVREPDIEAFLESKRIRPSAASSAKSAQPTVSKPKRPEEIAVRPLRRGPVDTRERDISFKDPLDWMIRGLH